MIIVARCFVIALFALLFFSGGILALCAMCVAPIAIPLTFAP